MDKEGNVRTDFGRQPFELLRAKAGVEQLVQRLKDSGGIAAPAAQTCSVWDPFAQLNFCVKVEACLLTKHLGRATDKILGTNRDICLVALQIHPVAGRDLNSHFVRQ
jgi:hypothetical protein